MAPEPRGQSPLVVGVDFDNTIADYGDLMHEIAVERGLVALDCPRDKKTIRDRIRALPDGELSWRSLQVASYGTEMHRAKLVDGVREFFLECRRREIPVYIVSHKTEYANFGDATVNLRRAAVAWLEGQGFFDEAGIGLSSERVFFETTREEKIARLAGLGVSHFIDDLEETFAESSFPGEVEKLLLSPGGEPTVLSDAIAYAGWREIRERVLTEIDLAALARLAGSPVKALARVGSGGNSKVYRVTCADGNAYAAKFYFQRTMDGLDRLAVEFGALTFLWSNGERAVPRPIAVDRQSQMALYEFVEGHPIDSRAVTLEQIDELVEFAGRLKRLASVKSAAGLPRAAEACFSFEELAGNIRGRIRRLESAAGEAPSYAALRAFLEADLKPFLEDTLSRTGSYGGATSLPPALRTLSPSDFGFHNALTRNDGSLLLVDFEYFGWDDPAKLISDFVLHPGMKLPDSAKARYVDGMLALFASDPELRERLALAYPLFAIKWCTVLLNEFVPVFLERREFAVRDNLDREALRFRQLVKAKDMLRAARETPPWLSPART